MYRHAKYYFITNLDSPDLEQPTAFIQFGSETDTNNKPYISVHPVNRYVQFNTSYLLAYLDDNSTL
jgi:hypothetical protein